MMVPYQNKKKYHLRAVTLKKVLKCNLHNALIGVASSEDLERTEVRVLSSSHLVFITRFDNLSCFVRVQNE